MNWTEGEARLVNGREAVTLQLPYSPGKTLSTGIKRRPRWNRSKAGRTLPNSCPLQNVYYGTRKVATATGGASQRVVARNLNWIWFLGAAVWFLDAALSMHHGALGRGLANAGISAAFLAIGIFFRRQAKRQDRRNSHH